MDSLTLHRLDEADIPDLVELSAHLDWDYSPEEVATVMKTGVVYGHKNKGKTISSAAIFAYGDALASVGMVMVHPDYRRRGLGKDATRKCLADFPLVPAMLVATAQGVPLYENLGFKTVDSLHKYICEQYMPPVQYALDERHTILPLTADHFEDVVRLDREALGEDRRRFLEVRIAQAKEGFILLQDEQLTGYGLSVQGPVHLVIGSIVAPNARLAAALIHRLAEGHTGKMRIDVPAQQKQLHATLESSGFEMVNQPPVMLLHAEKLPGRKETLFAIASQAYG